MKSAKIKKTYTFNFYVMAVARWGWDTQFHKQPFTHSHLRLHLEWTINQTVHVFAAQTNVHTEITRKSQTWRPAGFGRTRSPGNKSF